ncbi:MAG: sugar phosphate isomerase/epimerase family protein [Candidatus Acidiferrales bacterium]
MLPATTNKSAICKSIARLTRGLGLRCLILFSLALLFLAAGNSQSPEIKIGACGTVKMMSAVKGAGFDYAELSTSEIVSLSDAAFAELKNEVKQGGFPVYATDAFIPAAIKLTGPNIDKDQQMAYVRKAMDRVAALGAHIIVLGSGAARRVPDGFSHDAAFDQLVDFLKRVAPEARSRNIVVTVEPQSAEESNIINSVAEGVKLVRAVDDPNIQLVIDIYYLDRTHEDPSAMLAAKDYIRHFHFSNPNGRVFPMRWDEYNYAPFFAALHQMGYTGGISIDAHTTDFPSDAPQTVAFLRDALRR